MNKETLEKNQIFSTVAVFLFGNLIIAFPKGQGLKHSFWGYVVCFVFSVLVMLWLVYLQNKSSNFSIAYFEDLDGFKVIIKWLFVLLSLICLMVCCKDYVEMVDEIRLQKTPRWVISIFYVFVVVVLSQSKKRVIVMFAFVNLILICIGVIMMFLFSIPLFDIKLFVDSLELNVKNTFTQFLTFFIHGFGQLFLCLFFLGHQKKENAVKGSLYGILIGGTVFLVCFLNIIFVVGSEIIDKLSFPYANVTGMIITDENYNRLDVITYYIFFICDLIKASIIVKIITECFKKNKTKKLFAVIFSSLISIIFSSSIMLGEWLRSDFVNLLILILEMFFIVTITVITLKNTKIAKK